MHDTNTNVLKTFSALILTIISTKLFACKNTTFSVSFLIIKYYFSIKHFLLNTSSHPLAALKSWCNTKWLIHQTFVNAILSQMHPYPLTLWRAFLIFLLFVLSTGNKALAIRYREYDLYFKVVWFALIYKMFSVLIP